jgi:hypothetical protein
MSFNQPGRGDVHVSRPLTEISVAYRQSADAFIADRAFPVVRVSKDVDKYFTLPRGRFFSDEMEKRAAGARAASANWQVSTDSYQCDVWALANDIPDQVRANYDSPLDADMEATEFLTQKGLIRKERAWASEFFTTSVWTLDQTGVASAPSTNQFLQWSNSSSNPISDIRSFRRIVHKRTGFMPNKLVLGREVYDALLDHPDIVSRISGGASMGNPAIVQKQLLAALFELEEILVMDAVYNSAIEGAADSLAYIGGKAALLLFTPSAPALRTPSAGYTFAWTGLMGGDALGMRMKRLRMEPEESDRVEIQMAFDHKLVSADLGLFMASAVA